MAQSRTNFNFNPQELGPAYYSDRVQTPTDMAVTTQPTGFQMSPMGAMTGVPQGLEYLASLDQLIVKQKIEIVEMFTGCETRNKYEVFNSVQQQVYYAFEESETCHRICCGPDRGFIFHIQDNYQQEVMTIERPFKCWAGIPMCADGCCQYPIYIYDGQRNKIGMMRTTNYCFYPHFGIFDNSDQQMYEITGGCCRCQCPCFCKGDVDFPVTAMSDRSRVATVAKQWGGALREMVTDADTYNVRFPMDMHVLHKALLFASVFLVDMTLYEYNDNSGGGS